MLKYFQIQLCLQFIKNALLKIGLIVISRFFVYKYLPGLAVSNISEIYFASIFRTYLSAILKRINRFLLDSIKMQIQCNIVLMN